MDGPVAPGLARADGPALEAHRQRVGALAGELARRLRWNNARLEAVDRSVKSHHVCFPDPRLLSSLIEGVWGGAKGIPPAPATTESAEVARLLELACLFVERWEYSHYEPVTFEQAVEELSWIAREGFFDESHIQALSNVPSASFSQIQEAACRLPVFPAVALRAMQLVADPMAGTAALEEIVSSDPVLAGEILKAANSPRYSPARPVRSIQQAALFIGMAECCKVIAAASIRPLFAMAPAETLWAHSLEIASVAENVARKARLEQPQEAYFAGLVHDIGRLAFFALPRPLSARYTSLMQRDVEATFAELLLCGFDHALAGGEIARQWLLPEDLVEAVAKHHEPEHARGPLASVLFLAEHWSGSQEDLPSLARLNAALDRLSLGPRDSF